MLCAAAFLYHEKEVTDRGDLWKTRYAVFAVQIRPLI